MQVISKDDFVHVFEDVFKIKRLNRIAIYDFNSAMWRLRTLHDLEVDDILQGTQRIFVWANFGVRQLPNIKELIGACPLMFNRCAITHGDSLGQEAELDWQPNLPQSSVPDTSRSGSSGTPSSSTLGKRKRLMQREIIDLTCDSD